MPDAPAWERLSAEAAGFGVQLASTQVGALRRYQDLLCEWNRRFNLTAVDRPDEILVKHFLDSLTCARMMDLSAQETLLDVGTGAGFPGLVLKIAFPQLRVTLLDAVRKKVRFLEHVARELDLPQVRAIHARAEDAARPAFSPPLREAFDVVTARAVARLNVLAEWTLPFARVGGRVVAMKGPEIGPEVEEAGRAIALLGGGAPAVQEFILPGTDAGRSLVCIPKISAAPPAYPRLPGAARKSPL
jgi:16S rRNA (guanine527-N7)-methyltransferase